MARHRIDNFSLPKLKPTLFLITNGKKYISEPYGCFYCKRTNLPCTRDHFVPRAKQRGLHHNVVWCCGRCQKDKADLLIVEWFIKVLTWHRSQKNKMETIETLSMLILGH